MPEPNHFSERGITPVSIVYFGTPDYAVPALRALAANGRYAVTLVVTQPDRPAGRRHRLTQPPVKIAAEELGLHVYQPESLKSAESRDPLVGAEADVFVVAAYGLIFGRKTLAIPSAGCVNLHASLLPRYRGSNPIAAAILEGERESGVSLMVMDAGIDTGPVLDAVPTPLNGEETTESLTQRLAHIGADLVVSRLEGFVGGTITASSQPVAGGSLTRMMTKADGEIDWQAPAEQIEREVRAMWPWPRAWTLIDGQPLQIHRARLTDDSPSAQPGQVVVANGEFVVTCGLRSLLVEIVQPPGGKPMRGADWISGLCGELPRLGVGGVPADRPPLIVDL